MVPDFDNENHQLTEADYPQILSCGSKSIFFAEAVKGSVWGAGKTPVYLENCIVCPYDVVAFGEYHRQRELSGKEKARALYDIYLGSLKESGEALYAELIEQNYAVKKGGTVLCNIAVTTSKSRKLFEEISSELLKELKPLCKNVRENISRIVSNTLPEQLAAYTNGFAETWISFYSGVYLYEALYDKGFLQIPEKDNDIPVACWITER